MISIKVLILFMNSMNIYAMDSLWPGFKHVATRNKSPKSWGKKEQFVDQCALDLQMAPHLLQI